MLRSAPLRSLTLLFTATAARAQGTDSITVGQYWDYPNASTPIRAEVVARGMRIPWGLAFLPNGDLLASDRATGTLYRIDTRSGDKRPIAGVPPAFTRRDAGLLDVVLHPSFPANRLVYLSLAHGDSTASALQVIRARLDGDALTHVQVLYTAPQPLRANTDHFGGRLLLADGYLYVTSGDRYAHRDSAQSLSSPFGKVLRLREDGTIPPDNPFAGQGGALREIWSYGHRNQQGMTRHAGSGRILVGEHGPQGGDEVNVLARGANYGWPVVTLGEEYGGGRIGRGASAPGMTDPIHHYTPSIAPSGLTFYEGGAFPAWRGSLFMGALAHRHLNRLSLDGVRVTGQERLLEDRRWRVRVVVPGPDGFLYLGVDGGYVVRVRPMPR